ncbi:PROTEIN DEHYDRATION-INDUCED 19 [Salix koriyanagi]|uniref:PROTEIN DEHYDRATION-INDUCED 19 n=1 Tax=Salix koriyanagi TaxID=2511006 RepID=A0A9Q0TF87_9ROSI|nr:PROTEIN DEHYDRATION-INDUCED 19 [Salix koriyanagi]
MEDDKWSFGLSTSSSSRSYQSVLKSLSDLCIDFEEIEEDDDDELRTEYQCPYCTDDFDLVELCSHVDEEHYLEAKSGVFYFTILLCISPFDLLRSCLILIDCWATL